MGGATSLIVASCRKDLLGIVLWATPIDVLETFTNALGKENMLKFQQNETIQLDDEWGNVDLQPAFYQDLLKYDLKECVKNLPNIPKLFVHGELDDVVPVWQGQTAFDLASEPKELCLIKGGDHRFIVGGQEAIQVVYEWLQKYF